MGENKSTPGPWFATRPANAQGWWIVSTDQDGENCVDDSGDGGFEEANARLIAAAPEMLEALRTAECQLKAAFAIIHPNDEALRDGSIAQIQAAIAKAEVRS